MFIGPDKEIITSGRASKSSKNISNNKPLRMKGEKLGTYIVVICVYFDRENFKCDL
jgi:hypothetical protein